MTPVVIRSFIRRQDEADRIIEVMKGGGKRRRGEVSMNF
jgi:hypothetical protein